MQEVNMKTMIDAFDHDREYGRDIRLAGVVALASVTVAFLFAPQPGVEPYRLRRPVVSDLMIVDPGPLVYVPPKPPEPVRRGVPVASDNPEVTTIGRNTDFNELKPDITAPVLDDVKFWKVERKPRLLTSVTPVYPEMARAAGIEGKVVVSMVVDTLGSVARAQVHATSGSVLLDQAAVDAAYGCTFSPGYQRDRPVQVSEVVMTFNFSLH